MRIYSRICTHRRVARLCFPLAERSESRMSSLSFSRRDETRVRKRTVAWLQSTRRALRPVHTRCAMKRMKRSATHCKTAERFPHKPYINMDFPKNVTALINSTVTFRCPIVSDLEPYIEWLKVNEYPGEKDTPKGKLLQVQRLYFSRWWRASVLRSLVIDDSLDRVLARSTRRRFVVLLIYLGRCRS